ncbi:SprT-like domain-containing protein [Gemmatimonas sp.]|uniref:SprT-like domain-containing protein n=1 Tax=Gemmatimonas sp. TaxID=1962908 RepID=UPI003983C75E
MNSRHTQLGFDFFDAAPAVLDSSLPASTAVAAALPTSAPTSAPTGLPTTTSSFAQSVTAAVSQLFSQGFSPVLTPVFEPVPQKPLADDTRPARGRTAVRARTAVLFSRLEDLGLRGVDALVLMRTRTVMVSLIGRTLRIHEGYAEAPESVLRAIVAFAIARNRAERTTAREAILAFDVERGPSVRRQEPARPGDVAMVAQLAEAHRDLNTKWFAGALSAIPLRLSGRMATRLGHYDPGSRHTPPEIVMSRTHIARHGWREAMHTLLHEMVHQWQHETGRAVDHGTAFRQKARDVGITPAARRDVTPLEKRRRSIG